TSGGGFGGFGGSPTGAGGQGGLGTGGGGRSGSGGGGAGGSSGAGGRGTGGGGTTGAGGGGGGPCAPAYASSQCLGYAQGQMVSNGGHNYTCADANCRNCATVSTCEPGASGCPWGAVWTDNGPCH